MDKGRQTGAPVLDTTEARQASRVGLIWVLAASLGLALLAALALFEYF